MYAEFELERPRGLDEALGAMAGARDGEVLALAGGTNVIVDLRARTISPRRLVALGAVDGLRTIDVRDGTVTIGGRTTLTDILRHPEMTRCALSLVASAKLFGGQMVRNAATVAGNLCYGSPAADLVPPLLVLDAEVELASRSGMRRVPLHEFYLDYKRDARRPDELVTAIRWPVPSQGSHDTFYKLARRRGDAITVVGVAVALKVTDGTCRRARIALGAVAPMVKRAIAAERMLEGEPLDDALVDAAARRAVEESNPIDDVRASADYRRHCVHVLTRRLLNEARARLA